MHEKKIAHRDIKPLNVYITDYQEFKLADFGEAKFVTQDEDYHTIRGTPFYMSPEIMHRLTDRVEEKTNPFRDDIWGLARTFIELALGKLFPSLVKLNYADLKNRINDEFHDKCYPIGFYDLIFEMMTENKNDYLSADKVLEKIDKLLDEALSNERSNYYSSLKQNKDMTIPYLNASIGIPKSEIFSPPYNSALSSSIQANVIENAPIIISQPDNKYNSSRFTIPPPCLGSCSKQILNAFNTNNIIPEIQVNNDNIQSTPLPLIISTIDSPIIMQSDPSSSERLIEKNKSVEDPSIRVSKEEICEACKMNYSDPIILNCKHYFHKTCFKISITKMIKSAKNINEVVCPICKTPISERFITNFNGLDPKTTLKGNMLYFAAINRICPYCKTLTTITMLSSKLEPIFRRCTNCDFKFCSFCERGGAHRFSCDLFNDFKKGKVNISNIV